MKHLSDEELVFCHYREGDNWQTCEAHVATCEDCRTRYQALAKVLSGLDVPVPERSADYGSEVWRRLRPRLEGQPASVLWRLFTLPSLPALRGWALASALAALLLTGFFAGVFWAHRSSGELAARLRQELRQEFSADLQNAHQQYERDRQAMLTLLRQWAAQNASAYVRLREELELLASLTEEEMQQTKSNLSELAAQSAPEEQQN